MRIGVIALLFCLAGCSTQELVDRRVSELPPDTPAQYRAGYGDGCYTVVSETCSSSGRGQSRRDKALAKTDKDYALGWGDGARMCTCAGTALMYIPLTTD